MSLAKAGSVRVKLTTINIRVKDSDNAEYTFVTLTLLCYVQPVEAFHGYQKENFKPFFSRH